MKEPMIVRLVFPALLSGAIVALLASANQETGTTHAQELPNASQTQLSAPTARSLSGIANSSDSETLKNAIQSDIQQDPRLANASIAVTVTRTEIHLSGIAPDESGKSLALSLALSRAGGRPVEGADIKISPNRAQPNSGSGVDR